MNGDLGVALELFKVTKRFGAVTALEGVSLRVRAGERLAIVGPSGSGKTTLLRLVAGLERPDAGSIRLGGETVADARAGVWVPPERRRVGFVFQDGALFPHLTALGNVEFGLWRLPRRLRRRRALEALARVEALHLAERYPHELSGGEQQRVALARALAPEPQILLLDEPFAHLDEGLRRRLRGELKALLDALGTTALIVTHDPHEARELGDRVARLERGRLKRLETAPTAPQLDDLPVAR